MKKLFLFLLTFATLSACYAYWDTVGVYDSTYTITNDGPVLIPNTPPGTIFVGVNVGSVSTTGMLRVYSSSGGATNQIANVSLGTVMGYAYNVRISSGITYTTTGNAGGVTLIFKRIR